MNFLNAEQDCRAMQFYAEGMQLFQTGDYRNAIDSLHNCIQLLGAHTPDYVFFNLGNCDMYQTYGKTWPEAEQLIREAIAAYTDAYQRNPYQLLYSQAVQQANYQYTTMAQWQAAQLYAEGEHRLESGEYSSAADRFQACANLQGPNV
jgi:tetratricopeptide (TPR) repeat protein